MVQNTEALDLAINVFLAIGAVSTTILPTLYALRSPWRTLSLGRGFLAMTSSFALFLIIRLVSRLTNPPTVLQFWMYLVITALVAGSTSFMTYKLFTIQQKARSLHESLKSDL